MGRKGFRYASWKTPRYAWQDVPKRKISKRGLVVALTGLFLIWLMTGFFYQPIPLAHADYNTTFSHTRSPIASCTSATGCFTSARWTYNSTCVTFSSNIWLNFSYVLGTTGLGGKNCASASVAVLNSPINLQTISGKQLEMFIDWRNTVNTNTRETLASVILRTNGTLPSFSENWNPSADPSVKFRWDVCPSNLGCNSGNGQMDTYITHSESGTINSEGPASIDVISGNALCVAPHDCLYQEVLNFTGPTNFYSQKDVVSGSSSSTSTSSASGLQQGRDYYLFIKVGWNNGIAPTSAANVLFVSNTAGAPDFPGITSWTFASVPSSCTDAQAGNQKLAACGALGNPVPDFNINPLDPSSWANAIIKGLVWAATAAANAVLSFLGLIARAIQIGLNAIGQFAGWGNVGDQFITTLNNLVTLVSGQLGNAVGWLGSGISSIISYLTAFGSIFSPYVTGLVAYFAPWATVASAIVTLITQVGTVGFPTFDFVLFLFCTGTDGLAGFQYWWGVNRWMAFSVLSLGLRFLETIIGLVDWVLSHIPTIAAHLPPKLGDLFAGVTGGNLTSARTSQRLQGAGGKLGSLRGKFKTDRPSGGPGLGLHAIAALQPDALLLWVGGLFVFWKYLASNISPFAALGLQGITVGCVPTTCVANGVNIMTPMIGLWMLLFTFLMMDYFAHSVGYGIADGVVRVNRTRATFRPSAKSRKVFSHALGKAHKYVRESMNAKPVHKIPELEAARRDIKMANLMAKATVKQGNTAMSRSVRDVFKTLPLKKEADRKSHKGFLSRLKR